jgi:UDP-N-acetylmuramate--alanine ligase
MTIVTNVDADHLDYYPDLDAIKEAFTRFMNQVPFYGVNLVCGDDPHLKSLLPGIKRPMVTYGFEPGNDLQGEILELGSRSTFRVYWKGEHWGKVSLKHPGRHNIQNALGVIGLAMQADIAKESILKGLETFGGVGRRMERKGERDGVLVLDDYGHHPREIRLTLETVKEVFSPQRLIVVFQPHRFTRTRALFGEFCKSFPAADHLLLTEIYPAAEDPIPGVNGTSLAHGIRQVGGLEVDFCSEYSGAVTRLKEIARSGDVVITLGAGPVFQVGEHFLSGE